MDPLQRKKFALLGLAMMVLLACNLPGLARPTEDGAGPIYTAAARTIEAQLTQVSQPPPTQAVIPTFPPPTQGTVPTFPAPTAAPTRTTPPTLIPTATRAPTQAPQPQACDSIKFVKDVTVPDNTVINPGTSFVKTWRLRNTGTCTWTTSYSLVFSGGDQMGAPASVALSQAVAPGNAGDISVTLVAPAQAGTYRANFKLRNASGQTFGLGSDGSKPFWAQIKVPGDTAPSGITFDFLSSARSAEWISSVGAQAGTPVKFGGPADDPNGAAMIQDAVVLETGATSGKILLTYPRRENNGVITGLFPAYTVVRGDFLRGKLGFMRNPGGGCGSGQVNFQVVYMDGSGSPKLLDEWTKTCTGNFIDVNIDLSPLAGKSIQFGLVVEALSSPTDDWAIWNSLRIER